MSEQNIPKSDKASSAVSNDDSANHKQKVIPETFAFSPELLNVVDLVSPSAATEGATMPEIVPPAEKRGRGRPAGSGTGAKKKAKLSPEEQITMAQANASMVMKALDLSLAAFTDGEFSGNATYRALAESSLTEVMEEQGIEFPAWARACVFASLYASSAFTVPKAKTRIGLAWAKAKSWYTLWKD